VYWPFQTASLLVFPTSLCRLLASSSWIALYSGIIFPGNRLSAAEQQALATLQRAGKTPQPTVRRVRMLLLADVGLSNQAIADEVGTSRNLVQKWRKRFALYEPPPLLREEEVDPVAR
jgi:Homeodomain-like domain